MNVKISAGEFIKSGKPAVIVNSAYHPQFVAGARKLNGKFTEPDKWSFDGRDTEAVEELCRKVYGTTGADGVELVDIRIRVCACVQDDLYAYGRQIATSRRDYVKLGNGVVIIDGEFSTSASMRENYTTIEIRDVPISLVDDRCAIVRRPQADLTPPARPFEKATDEELSALLAAIQKELALRHPAPARAFNQDGEVYLTEDNAGKLTIGREDFWLWIKDPQPGMFEQDCCDVWQRAEKIGNPLAQALLDLDEDAILTDPPAPIVAVFDGEVIAMVRNPGAAALRYIGTKNVCYLDQQWI